MLIYKGGDEYDNHCGKEQRRAVVMISCNRHTLAVSPLGVSKPWKQITGADLKWERTSRRDRLRGGKLAPFFPVSDTHLPLLSQEKCFLGFSFIVLKLEENILPHKHCILPFHPQDNFNPVSEERGKVQDCFYLFEMDSSLACSPEVSHLSVGSILLVM